MPLPRCRHRQGRYATTPLLLAILVHMLSACAAPREPDKPAAQAFDNKAIVLETQRLWFDNGQQRTAPAVATATWLADGIAVTNAHVVAKATRITGRDAAGQEYAFTYVVGFDEPSDLAVIATADARVGGLRIPSLPPGRSLWGREVVVIANSAGLGFGYHKGHIVKTQRADGVPVVVHTAPVTDGASGAPVMDAETGEVLAVHATTMDSTTYGVAVTVTALRPLLQHKSRVPLAEFAKVSAPNWPPPVPLGRERVCVDPGDAKTGTLPPVRALDVVVSAVHAGGGPPVPMWLELHQHDTRLFERRVRRTARPQWASLPGWGSLRYRVENDVNQRGCVELLIGKANWSGWFAILANSHPAGGSGTGHPAAVPRP